MRLSHLAIKNFRCLYDVKLGLDDYTACIGANGAGKSSILYALGWFFDQVPIKPPGTHRDHTHEEVSVTVTLEELTDEAQQLLGRFGRRTCARFTRRYDPVQAKSSYSGVALMGPGFSTVLNTSGAGPMRAAYRGLRSTLTDLEELTGNFTSADISRAFDTWESNPDHADQLELVDCCPADELFVKDGPFSQVAKFVLIRGSADLSQHIEAGGRDTTISILTSSLIASAIGKAKTEWEKKHSGQLEELALATSQAVVTATEDHQTRINETLKHYVPGVEVVFHPSTPTINIRNDATISTKVRVDGREETDVISEGHGTQRAVMMAMVQSLADVPSTHDSELPLLVIASEEPEIYQHPIRSRFFARSLCELSQRPNAQVIIATHSPYFVRPDQFHALRRVSMQNGYSAVQGTTIAEVAQKIGKTDANLMKHLVKQLPKSFSEGFFSEAVVLVEGDTDHVIIEAVAERLGVSLEAKGISIWPVGSKDTLPVHYHILTSLGTKVYVVFDADYDGNDDQKKQDSCKKSTDACLRVVSPVDHQGNPIAFQFGNSTVVASNVTVFENRLETALEEWTSFQNQMANISSGKKKDAYEYQLAASLAECADIPEVFREIIDSIVQFAGCANCNNPAS